MDTLISAQIPYLSCKVLFQFNTISTFEKHLFLVCVKTSFGWPQDCLSSSVFLQVSLDERMRELEVVGHIWAEYKLCKPFPLALHFSPVVTWLDSANFNIFSPHFLKPSPAALFTHLTSPSSSCHHSSMRPLWGLIYCGQTGFSVTPIIALGVLIFWDLGYIGKEAETFHWVLNCWLACYLSLISLRYVLTAVFHNLYLEKNVPRGCFE